MYLDRWPKSCARFSACRAVRVACDYVNMLRRGSQLARARAQASKHLQTCSPLQSREFSSRGSSAWLTSKAAAAAGFDERREKRDSSHYGVHQQQFVLNHHGNRRRMSTKAVQSGAAADTAQTAIQVRAVQHH
jgi:hypothetical protein